jgi:hypothetical protein
VNATTSNNVLVLLAFTFDRASPKKSTLVAKNIDPNTASALDTHSSSSSNSPSWLETATSSCRQTYQSLSGECGSFLIEPIYHPTILFQFHIRNLPGDFNQQ